MSLHQVSELEDWQWFAFQIVNMEREKHPSVSLFLIQDTILSCILSCSGRICFTISGMPQTQSHCLQVWFQICPLFHAGQCAHYAPSSSWKPTLVAMRHCNWWLRNWSGWTVTLQKKEKAANFRLGQIPEQTHHPVKSELELVWRWWGRITLSYVEGKTVFLGTSQTWISSRQQWNCLQKLWKRARLKSQNFENVQYVILNSYQLLLYI